MAHQVFSTGWSSGEIVFKPHNRIHEFVKDVGANAHISDNIVLYAINYYDKLSRSTFGRKFREEIIAVYALYEALNKHEVPRLVQEISGYTGVSEQDIWRVEANLTLDFPLSEPKMYVQRFCTLLQLSYKEQLDVQSEVESLQELPLGNLRCHCLVAVSILLYCKEKGKKLTLKKICETCGISATSVHRVMRQLKQLKPQLLEISSLKWIAKHV